MSVFVELNALLYIGVLSLIGGLGWTFRDYVENLGDVAILSILILLVTRAFGYCIARRAGTRTTELESPSLIFDYVFYFGCLAFSVTLTVIETQFGLFDGWNTHLLIASLVFGALAYRFDNRFVLSLALSTLAGYLGLTLKIFDTIDGDRASRVGNALRCIPDRLACCWTCSAIKRHFFDVYLQLGANAMLLATASGIFEEGTGRAIWRIAAAYLPRRSISVSGTAGLRSSPTEPSTDMRASASACCTVGGPTGALLYFAVTGSMVIIALVMVARRFGRARMNLYSRDDERAIRVQRLVDDWTKSGLLLPEQRERMLPDLQVNLRRTNIFLRVTLFVFRFLIVNAMTGLFVVTLNLSEDATMFLALTASVAFFVVAHTLVKQFRLYHFGVEEAAAVASVSFGAIGLSMLLHSNFSILQALSRPLPVRS